MNKDVLEGKWKQLRGKARQQWGKLTDDQLDQINGSYDRLTGFLQEQYGYSVDKARMEVDNFLQRHSVDSDVSRM
jgi:uncharacterized protein YjbJ (UPF0337 family)